MPDPHRVEPSRDVAARLRADRLWPLVLAGACLLLGGSISAQQPTFRASTDLIAVDVQVVDGNGVPVRHLTAEDFDVRIDGKARRVVSAQLVTSDDRPSLVGAPCRGLHLRRHRRNPSRRLA